MSVQILHKYIDDCRKYGWNPSYEGLRAYKKLSDSGYLQLWRR